jgi:hypothetical protein
MDSDTNLEVSPISNPELSETKEETKQENEQQEGEQQSEEQEEEDQDEQQEDEQEDEEQEVRENEPMEDVEENILMENYARQSFLDSFETISEGEQIEPNEKGESEAKEMESDTSMSGKGSKSEGVETKEEKKEEPSSAESCGGIVSDEKDEDDSKENNMNRSSSSKSGDSSSEREPRGIDTSDDSDYTISVFETVDSASIADNEEEVDIESQEEMACPNNDHKEGFEYYLLLMTKKWAKETPDITDEAIRMRANTDWAKLPSHEQHKYCLTAKDKKEENLIRKCMGESCLDSLEVESDKEHPEKMGVDGDKSSYKHTSNHARDSESSDASKECHFQNHSKGPPD